MEIKTLRFGDVRVKAGENGVGFATENDAFKRGEFWSIHSFNYTYLPPRAKLC